ncbi:unnamed protein product, partial [Mesorhabditis belari]|uniref:Uncharacterized protein n=1 Tax=Mesorhabditis belari TaxID=2138241 RepID=A0AAF3E9F5_9BILA
MKSITPFLSLLAFLLLSAQAYEVLLCEQQPELCNLLAVERDSRLPISDVPKHAEKRAYDFVRFGRSDPAIGKEKKNSYDYIRFGKRSAGLLAEDLVKF